MKVLPCCVSVLLMGITGCSAYVPGEISAIQPGASVRVEVVPEAVGRVQELTRSNADRTVDGWVLDVTADSVVLDLWRTDLIGGGASFQPGRVRVPVSREEVSGVWEKRVSRLRTGALAALLAGGVYLVLDKALGGVGGGIEDGGGGGPDIILLPVPIP